VTQPRTPTSWRHGFATEILAVRRLATRLWNEIQGFAAYLSASGRTGFRICRPRPTHHGSRTQGGLGVLGGRPPYTCIPTGLVIPTEDGMPTALWKYLDALD
jgi:hypothetical protein